MINVLMHSDVELRPSFDVPFFCLICGHCRLRLIHLKAITLWGFKKMFDLQTSVIWQKDIFQANTREES